MGKGQLCLRSNKITSLKLGTLSNLTWLYTLEIESNQISSIDVGAISNLPELNRLSLKSNQLSIIKAGTFSNLPSLEKLDLASNKITCIQAGAFSNVGTFSNLPKLWRLQLQNNNINSIQAGAFSNLPGLKRLFLQYNKLTSIQPGTIPNLPNLDTLQLWSNPWQCDCKMAPLRQAIIKSSKVLNLISCVQPEKLSGQILKYISPEDLVCNDPTESTPSVEAQSSSAVVSTVSFGSTENNVSPTEHHIASTFVPLISDDPTKSTPPANVQNLFSSSVVSTPSFGTTENDVSPTEHPISSTFSTQLAAHQLQSQLAVMITSMKIMVNMVRQGRDLTDAGLQGRNGLMDFPPAATHNCCVTPPGLVEL
ncbi:PREDICTED: carboxypeptidase N subunit 2-like [Branchiostoma belcheri]|uniref:Carboxypeptidase N subunit 2-like n=1 Tax=Branchiostoma belcheri TaxID=7741 RepID=A0A6P5A4Z1_BRABE|nr:PREDICTED: carboxypeptidase N subunit 2-like [Branchiostoma belcheri]